MLMQLFRPSNDECVAFRSRRHLLGILAAGVCAIIASPFVEAGVQIRGAMSSVSPPVMAALQRRLLELGFAPGPDDGRWGPRTERAYADFCESEGLPVEDRLTREHVKALWGVDIDPETNDGQELLNFMEAIGVEF
jgi:peptidoglycan hydrolase-like protein with peptidoglycan-binding domain